MRLFDFIEEQCAGSGPSDRHSKQPNLANATAEQHAKTLLRLILGHIEPK
jgi:hypothetical protein